MVQNRAFWGEHSRQPAAEAMLCARPQRERFSHSCSLSSRGHSSWMHLTAPPSPPTIGAWPHPGANAMEGNSQCESRSIQQECYWSGGTKPWCSLRQQDWHIFLGLKSIWSQALGVREDQRSTLSTARLGQLRQPVTVAMGHLRKKMVGLMKTGWARSNSPLFLFFQFLAIYKNKDTLIQKIYLKATYEIWLLIFKYK